MSGTLKYDPGAWSLAMCRELVISVLQNVHFGEMPFPQDVNHALGVLCEKVQVRRERLVSGNDGKLGHDRCPCCSGST